jgi:hypothetical protein
VRTAGSGTSPRQSVFCHVHNDKEHVLHYLCSTMTPLLAENASQLAALTLIHMYMKYAQPLIIRNDISQKIQMDVYGNMTKPTPTLQDERKTERKREKNKTKGRRRTTTHQHQTKRRETITGKHTIVFVLKMPVFDVFGRCGVFNGLHGWCACCLLLLLLLLLLWWWEWWLSCYLEGGTVSSLAWGLMETTRSTGTLPSESCTTWRRMMDEG